MLDFYSSALFRIDWLVILEIMPTVIGIAASASLLMLLGKKNVQVGLVATRFSEKVSDGSRHKWVIGHKMSYREMSRDGLSGKAHGPKSSGTADGKGV